MRFFLSALLSVLFPLSVQAAACPTPLRVSVKAAGEACGLKDPTPGQLEKKLATMAKPFVANARHLQENAKALNNAIECLRIAVLLREGGALVRQTPKGPKDQFATEGEKVNLENGIRGFFPRDFLSVLFEKGFGSKDVPLQTASIAFGKKLLAAEPTTVCAGAAKHLKLTSDEEVKKQVAPLLDECVASERPTRPKDILALTKNPREWSHHMRAMAELTIDDVDLADAKCVVSLVDQLGERHPRPAFTLSPEACAKSDVTNFFMGLKPAARLSFGTKTLDVAEADVDLSNEKNLDLRCLRHMKNIRTLKLAGSNIVDLTPIAHLTGLVSLDLEGTKVDAITALQNMKMLHTLNLRRTQVSNVTPLKKHPELIRLYLDGAPVKDLDPLEVLPKIEQVTLLGCPVDDVIVLKSQPTLQVVSIDSKLVPREQIRGLQRLSVKVLEVLPDPEASPERKAASVELPEGND